MVGSREVEGGTRVFEDFIKNLKKLSPNLVKDLSFQLVVGTASLVSRG
jgi:hypothetical protein